MARLPVWPSGSGTPSTLRTVLLSPLNGWPTHTPADASPRPSRTDAHGSGPMWVATPSSRRTRTSYLLPVSRRTPGTFTGGGTGHFTSSPPLPELVKQCSSFAQVRSVEALQERLVDRRQEAAGLARSSLITPEPGEVPCGPKLPQQCAPDAREFNGLA